MITRSARAFWTRYERLARFLLVGGVTTGLYSGLTTLFILGHWATSRPWAAAWASLLTLPAAFTLHRKITYSDVAYDRGAWLRFFLLSLANLALNVGLQALTVALHWPFFVGLGVGWGLIPACNFVLNNLFVFHARTFFRLARG